MKEIIAKILRKWADKLSPIGVTIPDIPSPCLRNSVLPKIVKSQYKYPKVTTVMDFDFIRHDIANKMVDALLQHDAIHFSVHDGPGPFNTIEGTMFVYPLEDKQS